MTSKRRDQDAEPKYETIDPHFVADEATENDILGFTPYVRAITKFLQNTHPPLTLSVEGEWGSGKSSFMRQLRRALLPAGFRTVWFDAWHSDGDEALWASFALEFVRQLTEEMGPWRQWWLGLRLFFHRRGWLVGGMQALRLMLGLIAWLGGLGLGGVLLWTCPTWIRASTALAPALPTWAKTVAAWAPLFPLAALVFQVWTATYRWWYGFASRTLTLDLLRTRDSSYTDRVSFLEHFRKDFRSIVNVYGANANVCVFVDDLDRCDPVRAATLMEALNLMTAAVPELIFIVAMDRDKLAAAFAAKFDRILPLIAPPACGEDPTSKNALVAAQEFGHEFIEKLIQVPFHVPRPSPVDLVRLVDAIPHRHDGRIRSGTTAGRGLDRKLVGVNSSPLFYPLPFLPSPQENREAGLVVEVGLESEAISEITRLIGPSLGVPRRVKQFLNAFRLNAVLAMEMGLFRPGVAAKHGGSLTLGQLAKFMVIQQRWPRLIAEVERESGLLGKLQNIAIGKLNSDVVTSDWARNASLLALLRAGCTDPTGKVVPQGLAEYGMGYVRVDPWLQIRPSSYPVFAEEALQVMGQAEQAFPIKDPGIPGVTQFGLDFWRKNRHRLGRLAQVTLSRGHAWPLRLRDESGTELWINGCAGGYGGEGARGTLTILQEAGFGPEDVLEELVRTRESFALVAVRPELHEGELNLEYNSDPAAPPIQM